jgi:hypothetical protein
MSHWATLKERATLLLRETDALNRGL